MENDETEFEAALRETLEESGLIYERDYVCHDKSVIIESTYPVRRGLKCVTYFLAQILPSATVKLSHESADYKWLSLSELKEFLQYKNMILQFEKAEQYLR